MIARNIMLWVSLLLFACTQPLVEPARADYQASFTGTSFSGLTRSSTIAEYDGTIDASGNLLDISGSNYVTYSEQFDNAAWTKNSFASIVADAIEAPDGTLTADALKETGAGGVGTATDPHLVYTASPTVAASGASYVFSVNVKAANQDWTGVGIYDNTTNKYFFWSFDVANGVMGSQFTTGSDGTPTSKGISCSKGWCRCWVEMVASGANNLYPEIYILESDNDGVFVGSDQISLYIHEAQLSKVDRWRTGPGVYHPTTATNKPLHDLAPTNAPTGVESYLQRPDGNRWKGRSFNGSNQRYSIAHNAAMNVFDGDHTATFVLKSPSSAPGSTIHFFSHGAWNSSGMRVAIRTENDFVIYYFKTSGGAGNKSALVGSSVSDGKYHVLQINRSSDVVTMYLDGVPGSSVNASGYGEDGSETWYVGSDAATYYNSDILYTRVDADALSLSTLAKEREKLQGIANYAGGTSYPAHTFTRATTATTEFSNGSLGYAATGVPRVIEGFLSEPATTNYFSYSQTIGSGSLRSATISSDVVTAPDGTLTMDGIIATSVEDIHGPTITATPTNGLTYFLSAYAMQGAKEWATLRNSGIAGGTVFFNLNDGRVGTMNAGFIDAGVLPTSIDGVYRIWSKFTGNDVSSSFYVTMAEADNDDVYTGDDVTVEAYVWGLQYEQNNWLTSYVPVPTATAVTRNADVLTQDPFKYDDRVLVGNETMHITFDQDPASSPVTSNEGTFSWTASGTRVKETTERLGTYWKFDGSGTQLSIADSASWTPGVGDHFSIVAAVVPEIPPSTYGYIISKYNTSDNRSWALYIKNDGQVTFGVAADGINAGFASKTSGWVAGRPVFLAATYEYVGAANSVGKLYVNDMSVITDFAFPGPPEDNGEPIYIGRSANGSRFQGKMLFINWYKGTLLDATAIANMYEQFKTKYAVAPQMGEANEEQDIYLNFKYKLRASSASAGGDSLVELGNSYGKSDADSNRLACRAVTTTLVCSYWEDDTTATERTLTATGLTQNTWHDVKLYLDLDDMSNSTMTVDGAAGTPASMTGNQDANWRDADIHIGHDYTGASGFANGWVKDVVLNSRP